MKEITHPYERVNLYFWYYTSLFIDKNDYQSLLDKLIEGQEEGLSYPFMTGQRSWPGWVKEIEKLDGYASFLEKNTELREEGNQNCKPEYFVSLPEDYNPEFKYPLLIALHGGIGSHIQTYRYWESPELKDKFIIAYLQGASFKGTYFRRFGVEFNNIIAMYNNILEKYPIDTSNIVIGGPSAGGYRSFALGLKQMIPASGLLLMFPVIPNSYDTNLLIDAAKNNMRVVMITGENDFGIKKQKKLAYHLDESGVTNRFVIYPEKGHEYPDDFAHQLDVSVGFLLNKNK